jgi:ligand-binding sensor domain-containing protein
MSLVQGNDGLVYVGTEGGLFRFDGRRFEALDLPVDQQFITVLLPGADGRLWVGTRHGLGWFDSSWKFHSEGGPLAQRIHYLGFDAQGELWVYAGDQLIVRSAGSFRLVASSPAVTGMVGVFADPAEPGVWVLGKEGLWRLDPSNQHWDLDRLPMVGSGDAPLAFGVDGAGFLWLRTRSCFWRRGPGKAPWVRLGGSFAGAVPDHLGITRDREGWLWINTASGLFRCKGQIERAIDTGPRGYIPVTGMLDRDHSPWVASLGVTQVLGQGLWTLHDVEEGLPSNVVWTTVRDHQGRLWAATDGGLVVQEPAGWKLVAKGQFSRVRIHPNGTILAVGSPGGTLYTVDPSSLKIAGHMVTCMQATDVSRGLGVEADGTVWISDYRNGFACGKQIGGQWRWEPGTIEGKCPTGLFEIVQDSAGAIYLPAMSTVYHRSGNNWESLGETLPYTPLGAQRINDEEIWVAYLDRPVLTRHRKEGGVWRRVDEWWPFPEKDQLQILSLAARPDGDLWVGTSQGLGCLDPGPRRRKSWIAPGEGIPGADATTQGLFLEPNGDLWFSTTSGLGLFHTAEQNSRAPIPAPLLVGWAVQGKALPLDGTKPSLEPRADLDARFAIPYSLYPSTLGLEARLSGVDRDWVRLDGNHLRYGALAGGHYQLQVRLHREGGAAGQITTLAFRVLPKWWETWWAWMLYVLAASGAVYGVVVLRSRALH